MPDIDDTGLGDNESEDRDYSQGQTPTKRLRIKNRKVHDIESALDPEKYDPYIPPNPALEAALIFEKKLLETNQMSSFLGQQRKQLHG